MADFNQTIEEIEDGLANGLTSFMLYPADKIICGYEERGQPFTSINSGKIYLNVFEEESEIESSKIITPVYNNTNLNFDVTIRYYRMVRLQLIMYGDGSYKEMTKLKNMLLLQKGKDFLTGLHLSILNKKTTGPKYIRESVNEKFWKRADLNMWFYTPVVINSTCNSIEEFNITYKLER
jgi:hypothetical protein